MPTITRRLFNGTENTYDGRMEKILAVIPARGGSKGILKKNIRPFCGKPLLAYSIEAAKGAPSVDRVIISTDSQEIADVGKKYGAEVPFLRPPELAEDGSKVVDAVVHLLEKLKGDEGYEPTHVLLLQPTSPMRTSEDIENAIALMKKRGADNVISVCRTETLLVGKDENDVLTIINEEHARTGNRQQLPRYYKFDGSMIYLIETRTLLADHSFLGGTPVGYEIERWRSFDLDEPQDFVVGELIYNNRDDLKKKIRSFS